MEFATRTEFVDESSGWGIATGRIGVTEVNIENFFENVPDRSNQSTVGDVMVGKSASPLRLIDVLPSSPYGREGTKSRAPPTESAPDE